MKLFPLVAATAIGFASVAPARGAEQLRPPFQPVQAVLDDAVAAKTLPMAGVVVARNGQVLFRGSAGVAGENTTRPFRTDTVQRIQSLTKPIIAVAILMLMEEGKLRLDDPASKYVPVMATPFRVRIPKAGQAIGPNTEYDYVPSKRAITLKDLLTHTSGLQSIGQPNAVVQLPAKGETLETWLPKLAASPLDFQPGERWAYSNVVGFDVLARVVEVVSGERIDRFLQRRIFDPVGMKDTGFGMWMRASTAGRVISIPDFTANERAMGQTYFSGAAGLWGTVDDYHRFAQMLADGGQAGGRRLLRAETVRMMTTNQVGNLYPGVRGTVPGWGFGLSVAVLLDPAAAGSPLPAGTFGWDGVGQTRFWSSPREDQVIAMHAPAAPVQVQIERAVQQALAN